MGKYENFKSFVGLSAFQALAVKCLGGKVVTVMATAGLAPADQGKEPAGYAGVWPEHYQR